MGITNKIARLNELKMKFSVYTGNNVYEEAWGIKTIESVKYKISYGNIVTVADIAYKKCTCLYYQPIVTEQSVRYGGCRDY